MAEESKLRGGAADEEKPTRPVTLAQLASVLVATLALFFIVAFAMKAVEAHQLRAWRDRLNEELAQMERQRDELTEELRHRHSTAWVEEALREAGQVPEGVLSVMVVASTPEPAAGTPTPRPLPTPTLAPEAPEPMRLLDNPNWHAWQRLIWRFD